MAQRCCGKNKAGSSCGGKPLTGTSYCRWHTPQQEQQALDDSDDTSSESEDDDSGDEDALQDGERFNDGSAIGQDRTTVLESSVANLSIVENVKGGEPATVTVSTVVSEAEIAVPEPCTIGQNSSMSRASRSLVLRSPSQNSSSMLKSHEDDQSSPTPDKFSDSRKTPRAESTSPNQERLKRMRRESQAQSSELMAATTSDEDRIEVSSGLREEARIARHIARPSDNSELQQQQEIAQATAEVSAQYEKQIEELRSELNDRPPPPKSPAPVSKAEWSERHSIKQRQLEAFCQDRIKDAKKLWEQAHLAETTRLKDQIAQDAALIQGLLAQHRSDLEVESRKADDTTDRAVADANEKHKLELTVLREKHDKAIQDLQDEQDIYCGQQQERHDVECEKIRTRMREESRAEAAKKDERIANDCLNYEELVISCREYEKQIEKLQNEATRRNLKVDKPTPSPEVDSGIQQDLQERTRANESLAIEHRDLQLEVHAKQTERSELCKEIASSKQYLQDLKDNLTAKDAELNILLLKVASNETQLDTLGKRLKLYQDQHHTEKTRIASAEEEYERLQAKIKRTRADIQNREAQDRLDAGAIAKAARSWWRHMSRDIQAFVRDLPQSDITKHQRLLDRIQQSIDKVDEKSTTQDANRTV